MPISNVKYVGFDVHQDAITAAVRGATGKLIIEIDPRNEGHHPAGFSDFLKAQRGELHVKFEEGTWAAWLYDILCFCTGSFGHPIRMTDR